MSEGLIVLHINLKHVQIANEKITLKHIVQLHRVAF